MTVDDDGAGQGFDDPACPLRHFIVGFHIAEHHDELIAAHADHHVGLAHAGAQALGHLLQQLVAGFVTAGIVDMFETIEVEKHHTPSIEWVALASAMALGKNAVK